MITLVFGIFFFLLGTAIGSFLNVVILRYNTGKGIGGRSHCFSCGKELRWFELIPVFSFIFLRGRCARCKSKISPQYVIVEFLTGCTFLGLFLKFQGLSERFPLAFVFAMIYFMVIFSLLIVIFVYDLRHKIIPDGLVLALAIISLIGLCIVPIPTMKLAAPSFISLLAGPLIASPFAALWLVSKGRWMGLGDAKLAWVMGWVLGLSAALSSIILAFWIGAAFSIVLILVQKRALSGKHSRLTMKSEIPFAPFLIIGLSLVFFLGIHIIDLSTFFGH